MIATNGRPSTVSRIYPVPTAISSALSVRRCRKFVGNANRMEANKSARGVAERMVCLKILKQLSMLFAPYDLAI